MSCIICMSWEFWGHLVVAVKHFVIFDPMWQIFVCTLQCATRRAEGRRSVLVASSSHHHHPPDGLPSLTQPQSPASCRQKRTLCVQHSLLTAQPAELCGLVAAAGQPRHHLHCQHNTTYQHLPALHTSPPHSPVQYDPPPPFLPELGVSWGTLRPAGTGAAKPKLQMLTETRISL